jgi:hypothetical protein
VFLLFLVLVGVEGPEASDDEMLDEQEDIGLSMTINDELRLYGMTGDDEDDVAGMPRSSSIVVLPRNSMDVLLLTHFPSMTLMPPTHVASSRAMPMLTTAPAAGLTALLPQYARKISRSSPRR